MKQFLTAVLLCSGVMTAGAQYAPQAGISGSDAVSVSSPLIKRWATGCHVRRGLQQIDDASFGYALTGDSSVATGIADGNIVSLGDSGIAVLTFAAPITNGPGADFAVFENGFLNFSNPEEAFLELAFVEVSSDGIHYTRFPARSVMQDTLQMSSTAGLMYMNARHFRNLAGKYTSNNGTPFDLQELAGTPGLDVSRITHVRLVDVIGDIGAHGSLDSAGHKINDPFPTPFPTSGFDLDAVAVINGAATGINTIGNELVLSVAPNPATGYLRVKMKQTGRMYLKLTDAMGRVLKEEVAGSNEVYWMVSDLATGMYYLSVRDENNNQWSGKVFRQ